MRKVKFNVVKSKNIGTGVETDIPAIKGEGINYDAEIDQLATEIEEVNDKVGALPKDVQINGASIVDEGVADIKANNIYGVGHNQVGLYVTGASQAEISARNNGNRPIVTTQLDYAVKQAMCDGKGAEWTDAEKANAQKRIGLGGKFELIEEIVISEDTNAITRTTEPNGTNYNFKKVAIEYVFPIGSNAPSINNYFFQGGTSGLNIRTYIGASSTSLTEYEKKGVCFADIDMHLAYSTAQFVPSNGSTTALSTTSLGFTAGIEVINAVRLNTTPSSSYIPQGTNIKIYGIRA